MGTEINNNNHNRSGNWFVGVILIALGGAFLVNQLVPGFISGLLWAGAFAVGGLAVYNWYRNNPSQWWALIPAYVAEVVAALIALGTLHIPGELIGTFVMLAIGAPFLYVYLRDHDNWWALIPAYTMAVIGGLILLAGFNIINGTMVAAYINFAIAAPFLYVYLTNRNNWWALIPGGIMATIGLAFFVAGMAYLIPVFMILVGIYLLVRQTNGKKSAATQTSTPEAPAQPSTPQYGPEADKPLAEFEPLGARGNGPKFDK